MDADIDKTHWGEMESESEEEEESEEEDQVSCLFLLCSLLILIVLTGCFHAFAFFLCNLQNTL